MVLGMYVRLSVFHLCASQSRDVLRMVVCRRETCAVDGVLDGGKDSGEMSRWLLFANLREHSEKEGQSAGRHVANPSFKVLDSVNESNKP
jgi:hypothetical protein